MTLHPRNFCNYCDSSNETDVLQCDWILNCRCCESDADPLEWHWDGTNSSSTSVKLSEDRKTVTFHPIQSYGTATARGDMLLSGGIHYWEIKVLSPMYGTDIMVGIGDALTDINKYHDNFVSGLGIDSSTWGLSYRGILIHNGESISYSTCMFKRGSILGCLLDLWHGDLLYFVDGVPALAVWIKNIPPSAYYPMVCSTAVRTGFRLIRTVSYPVSLQYLACRAFLRSNRDGLASRLTNLPPALKKKLKTDLPWSLFMRDYPTQYVTRGSHRPSWVELVRSVVELESPVPIVRQMTDPDLFLWTSFDYTETKSYENADLTNIYDLDVEEQTSEYLPRNCKYQRVMSSKSNDRNFNPKSYSHIKASGTLLPDFSAENYHHLLWGEFVESYPTTPNSTSASGDTE